MKQTVSRHIVFALMIVGSVVFALWGCGDEDVPFVVDEDELTRYVSEVAEARELFRTSNLIRTDPYTVPFDDGAWHDSLISKNRDYDVSLVTDKNSANYYADYGNLGQLREALVVVTDSFRVQTTRVYSDTTIVDTSYRDLTRYAFFLKLGDDAKDYVGWSLWGYSGLGGTLLPVSVDAQRWDLSDFPGDLGLYLDLPKSQGGIPRVPYVRLSDIDTVVLGSRLKITTEKLSTRPATYQLLSDYADGGAFQARLVQAGGPDVDTLSYKTESSTGRYYRMLFMQAFTEDQGDFVGAWCVPYRQ
ncbi:MAG: hypothetical protein GY867_08690 [bacterium]|nr:hypothetical protein [bacterium]